MGCLQKLNIGVLIAVAVAASFFTNCEIQVEAMLIDPPESILQGGEAMAYLWKAADAGTFFNVVPGWPQDIQYEWDAFLRQHGEAIVDDFYR